MSYIADTFDQDDTPTEVEVYQNDRFWTINDCNDPWVINDWTETWEHYIGRVMPADGILTNPNTGYRYHVKTEDGVYYNVESLGRLYTETEDGLHYNIRTQMPGFAARLSNGNWVTVNNDLDLAAAKNVISDWAAYLTEHLTDDNKVAVITHLRTVLNTL